MSFVFYAIIGTLSINILLWSAVAGQHRESSTNRGFLAVLIWLMAWCLTDMILFFPFTRGFEVIVLKTNIVFALVTGGFIFNQVIYTFVGKKVDLPTFVFSGATAVMAALASGAEPVFTEM